MPLYHTPTLKNLGSLLSIESVKGRATRVRDLRVSRACALTLLTLLLIATLCIGSRCSLLSQL